MAKNGPEDCLAPAGRVDLGDGLLDHGVAAVFGLDLEHLAGLPYQVTYRDRVTCAGAAWCHGQSPPGASAQQLLGQWSDDRRERLVRVGQLLTVFGTPRGIYISGAAFDVIGANPDRTMTSVVVERSPGCFVEFTLSGGP